MRYALAAYGWPVYMMMNTGTGLCKIMPHLRYVLCFWVTIAGWVWLYLCINSFKWLKLYRLCKTVLKDDTQCSDMHSHAGIQAYMHNYICWVSDMPIVWWIACTLRGRLIRDTAMQADRSLSIAYLRRLTNWLSACHIGHHGRSSSRVQPVALLEPTCYIDTHNLPAKLHAHISSYIHVHAISNWGFQCCIVKECLARI